MVHSLALLLVCFTLGLLARASGRFPEATVPVLNAWVLRVAMPALVLQAVHALGPVGGLVPAVAGLWLAFLVVAVPGLVALRLGWLTRPRAGALILSLGLGNTAFVGLPLVEGLAGREGLAVAVVVDQLGSFLLLSLVALPLAAHLGGGALSWRALVSRVVLFPPVLALVAALLLRPWAYPAWAEQVLGRLGQTLSPLALFSVGYQLRLSGLRGRLHVLALGLGYKLVAAPLLVALALGALGLSGLPYKVAVVQAGMASMVTAALLASEWKLEPELPALMVGLGVPLSFLTGPWVWRLVG